MDAPGADRPEDEYRRWALVRAGEGFGAVPWRWYDGLIGIVVILAPQVMINFIRDLPRDWRLWILQLPFWAKFVIILLFPTVWRFAYPLVMARIRLQSFRIRFPSARQWLWEALIALGVTLAIVVLNAAVGALSAVNPHEPLQIPSVWEGAGEGTLTILLLVSAVVVAPATEEIFFRGMVYNWLKRFCPIWLALLLQAAIFAIFHPFGPAQLALLFISAVILGIVYEWRKTLLTPTLIHIMRNAIAAIAVAMLGKV
jgi:membrane protease YdiL (CAAX protease family)